MLDDALITVASNRDIHIRNEPETYRTFPVPGNIPRNVPLFLVSSVFPYSKGEEGR